MRVRIVVRTDDVVLYRQDGPVSTIWYRRYGTILTRPLVPTLERLRLWGGVKHLAQTRCWNSPTLGSE